MAKTISKRAKIIIATTLTAIMLIGAIVSIVFVLAATQQNISSNISVSYVVDGVGAKVSAKYGKIPDETAATLTQMTTSDGKSTELIFNVSDSQSQNSLTPNGNITLTQETGTSVIFEYRFENIAEMPFVIGLDIQETGTTKNITESFYFSKTALPTTEYSRVEYSDFAIQSLEYQDVLYIYIKVSVANLNLNAFYNKAYNWEINEAATEKVEVTLINNAAEQITTNAYIGAAVPVLDSVPTSQDGEVFLGYFDTQGTQYISNTGAGIKEVSGAIMLTAEYQTIANVVILSEETTVTNTSEDEIYVPTQAGTTFNYGGTNYTSNGEYLLLSPEQTITMTNTAAASYADSTNTISTLRPLDIAEKKFYSAYGEYPQTYVGSELNEILFNLTDDYKTGKSYTTDAAGATIYLDEYLYEGKKYAKIDSQSEPSGSPQFSNGEGISSATVYFFYVEPILCKAMEVGNGTATMMSVDILGSMAFDQDANDWKSSDIRAYLNGAFLAESGLNAVAKVVTIKNLDPFGNCTTTENTTDKIFLASAEEICKWTGSSYDDFVNNWGLYDENNSKRQIAVSDMAKATYCDEYDGYGYYFLRSPGDTSDCVCYVFNDGVVRPNYNYSNTDYGFCPAFVVEI